MNKKSLASFHIEKETTGIPFELYSIMLKEDEVK